MRFDDMEEFIREVRNHRFEPGASTSEDMQTKFEEIANGIRVAPRHPGAP